MRDMCREVSLSCFKLSSLDLYLGTQEDHNITVRRISHRDETLWYSLCLVVCSNLGESISCRIERGVNGGFTQNKQHQYSYNLSPSCPPHPWRETDKWMSFVSVVLHKRRHHQLHDPRPHCQTRHSRIAALKCLHASHIRSQINLVGIRANRVVHHIAQGTGWISGEWLVLRSLLL